MQIRSSPGSIMQSSTRRGRRWHTERLALLHLCPVLCTWFESHEVPGCRCKPHADISAVDSDAFKRPWSDAFRRDLAVYRLEIIIAQLACQREAKTAKAVCIHDHLQGLSQIPVESKDIETAVSA